MKKETENKLKFIENMIFENYFYFYKNHKSKDGLRMFNDVANYIRQSYIEELNATEKAELQRNILRKRGNFIAILNLIDTRKNVDVITLLDLAEYDTGILNSLKHQQKLLFGRVIQ